MELLEGEEIVWSGRPSWRSMLAFYIKWMLLALAIGVAAQLIDSFTSIERAPLVVLARDGGADPGHARRRLAQAHRHALHRHQPAHQHPPRHLLARRPRDVVRAPAERQDLPEPDRALLGVGLVDFDTAAGDDFDFKFVGINDPAGLAHQIAELQRAAMAGRTLQHAAGLSTAHLRRLVRRLALRHPLLAAGVPADEAVGSEQRGHAREVGVERARRRRSRTRARRRCRRGRRSGTVERGLRRRRRAPRRAAGRRPSRRSSTNAIALQGAPAASCSAASDARRISSASSPPSTIACTWSARLTRLPSNASTASRHVAGHGRRLPRGAVDQHHHLLGAREQLAGLAVVHGVLLAPRRAADRARCG